MALTLILTVAHMQRSKTDVPRSTTAADTCDTDCMAVGCAMLLIIGEDAGSSSRATALRRIIGGSATKHALSSMLPFSLPHASTSCRDCLQCQSTDQRLHLSRGVVIHRNVRSEHNSVRSKRYEAINAKKLRNKCSRRKDKNGRCIRSVSISCVRCVASVALVVLRALR